MGSGAVAAHTGCQESAGHIPGMDHGGARGSSCPSLSSSESWMMLVCGSPAGPLYRQGCRLGGGERPVWVPVRTRHPSGSSSGL